MLAFILDMPGSVSRHVTHANARFLTIQVVATCISTSAERFIALCLLVWLGKKYAKEDFVSEVPVTIMHVSAMS